jgi:hypothetical protein
MSKKIYSASNTTPTVSQERVPETVTIHLHIDNVETSSPRSSQGVSAFEDNDVFVAKPFEISKQFEDILSADMLQYDPDDIHTRPEYICNGSKSIDNPSSYAKKVVNLLKDFREKSKVGEWPYSTSTLCHWCCHGFPNPPVGIPVRYDGEHFFVTGCFCSFSCAAAYNMDSGESNTTIGNRHSLLCSLASRLDCDEDIKAAPPRLSLSCFGGYLNINEFRAFTDGDRIMITNVPPMKSMAQQIEEVNENDVGSGYEFIPIDHVRCERGLTNDLTLKRNKPLLNLKNTLHGTMNVKIITSE